MAPEYVGRLRYRFVFIQKNETWLSGIRRRKGRSEVGNLVKVIASSAFGETMPDNNLIGGNTIAVNLVFNCLKTN